MIWMPKLLYFLVWRNWLLFSCSLQKQLRKNKKKKHFAFPSADSTFNHFSRVFRPRYFPNVLICAVFFFLFYCQALSYLKAFDFQFGSLPLFPSLFFFQSITSILLPPLFFSFKPIMFTTFNRLCSENIRCFFFLVRWNSRVEEKNPR